MPTPTRGHATPPHGFLAHKESSGLIAGRAVVPIVTTPQALSRQWRFHDAIAGWAAIDRQPTAGNILLDSIRNAILKRTDTIQIVADQLQYFVVYFPVVFGQKPRAKRRTCRMSCFFTQHRELLCATLQRRHKPWPVQ
jgi:hypothetical protein